MIVWSVSWLMFIWFDIKTPSVLKSCWFHWQKYELPQQWLALLLMHRIKRRSGCLFGSIPNVSCFCHSNQCGAYPGLSPSCRRLWSSEWPLPPAKYFATPSSSSSSDNGICCVYKPEPFPLQLIISWVSTAANATQWPSMAVNDRQEPPMATNRIMRSPDHERLVLTLINVTW